MVSGRAHLWHVAVQESTRLALSLGDLARGHVARHFGAGDLRRQEARDRGQVEPFVRLDQVQALAPEPVE
ncbi:hypothetical protein GCM10020258_26320 [Sphingomonas yabuuchiae]